MSRIPSPYALATALWLAATPAMAASVSTAWADLPSNDQEQCLAIGQRAVQDAGFRASISQDRQTVFGWRGEEALTIRCISSHRIAVIFAWVSDHATDSGRLVQVVSDGYRNPRGQGGNLGGGNPGGGNLGGGNFGGGGALGGGTFGGGQGGVVKR